MLIIGGFKTNTSSTHCDMSFTGGQRNLYLGQESNEASSIYDRSSLDDSNETLWQGVNSSITEYRVPNNILSEILGGHVFYCASRFFQANFSRRERGDARRRKPATWANDDLAAIFSQTYFAAARTATRTDLPTSSNLAPAVPPAKHLGGGAIAGIVLGAVAAITAIGAAVTFWLKKKRRNQGMEAQEDTRVEMEDQDVALAGRKWFLSGRWRSEAEAKSDPHELDSKTVHVVAGPPVELDSLEVQHERLREVNNT